jgi:hypothetical protein
MRWRPARGGAGRGRSGLDLDLGFLGCLAGLRNKLSQYDFGSASFDLKGANFADHLMKAEPAGISFDPNA